MRRIRRLLPSPAMVVAVVALVMSLGGSAYALVITGKSIKNGTVTNKDIRNHSLTGTDMRKNKVGGGAIDEATLGPVPSAFVAAGGSRFAVVNGRRPGRARPRRELRRAHLRGSLSGDLQRRRARLRLLRHGRRLERRRRPRRTPRSASARLARTSTAWPCAPRTGPTANELDRPFHLIVMC